MQPHPYLTRDELVERLRCKVGGGGGAEKWAAAHGVSKSYVNQVLRGFRPPRGKLLRALKMRLVVSEQYHSVER
jgi:hypothetical protein